MDDLAIFLEMMLKLLGFSPAFDVGSSAQHNLAKRCEK